MKSLRTADPVIFKLLQEEEKRQKEVLEMIPSENYASKNVLQSLSSVLNNKYSEGYPRKRYYQGNEIADKIEIIAQERAKELFGVPYANVQPYSGSPANAAVYFALLEPLKDTILGLSLSFGGHLTHGAPVSFAGKYFKAVNYALSTNDILDYEQIDKLAQEVKPKMIVCGATAYPRIIDFKKFAEIADKVDAYLLADISHIAGLVVGGVHPSPVPHAHIVMTTTHKTLRGPRGAILMVTGKGIKKNPDLPALIDKAVFPGLQGGPHDNQTAAIAVALTEAGKKSFAKYAQQIVKNAQALAKELIKLEFDLVSGGTDNHLILIDLSNKNVNGAIAALALEAANIVVNKNAVPYDTNPPFYPSGIRLGTPAVTTRKMKESDMKKIARWIFSVVEEMKKLDLTGLPQSKEERPRFIKIAREKIAQNKTLQKIQKEVKVLCRKFPLDY